MEGANQGHPDVYLCIYKGTENKVFTLVLFMIAEEGENTGVGADVYTRGETGLERERVNTRKDQTTIVSNRGRILNKIATS